MHSLESSVELDPETLQRNWEAYGGSQDRAATCKWKCLTISGVIDRERLNQLIASRYKGIRKRVKAPSAKSYLKFAPNCGVGRTRGCSFRLAFA